MDDQLLFDEFHAAYDFEPRAGSFERLRATLVSREVRSQGGIKSGFWLPRMSRRLIAAVAIVALAIAATGAFIAIRQYAHPTVPVVGPPRACAINQPLADGSSVCSADDAAVRGQDKVFITHDGGRTWLTLKMPFGPTDSPQIDVRWIDSDDIVVVYGSHLIEVTTDGGTHWRVITSGWEQGTNLPFFLNADEGWVYGASGLFHTTDGGSHWTAVSAFPSFKQFDWWADRIFFNDSEDGFIKPSGYNQPWVTHDGGRTWSQGVVSQPPPASQFGNVPQGPFMFGRSGLIAFWNADGTGLSVYKTSDGGLTWSAPRSTPGRWLAPLDMSAWWVVDATGRLLRTTDGGNSWQSVLTDLLSLQPAATLVSVTPVGNGGLWGLATDGFVTEQLQGGVRLIPNSVMVRSTDGGAHWSLVKLPGQ